MQRRWGVVGTVAASAALAAGCGSTKTVLVEKAPSRSSPSPSLSQLMSRVQSGVVRIEADTCDGTSIGTGFLLSPRIVATVEHVIDGASAITFQQGDRTVATGSVIGADPDQDLALVMTNTPVEGQTLTLSPTPPQLGDAVAAVGFPLDLPLSVTQGTVSGLDRTIPIDNYDRQHLIQTDAAVNHGNSGGPLLSVKTGQVVGLVDLGADIGNGLGFAVSSDVAARVFAGWRNRPQSVPAVGCPNDPDVVPPSAAIPPFILLPPPTVTTTPSPTPPPPSGNTGTPTTNSSPSPPPPSTPANPDTSPPPSDTTSTGGTGNTGSGTTSTGTTGNTGGGGNPNGTGNTGTGTAGDTGNTGSPAGAGDPGGGSDNGAP